jgi:heat shock protein HslJ
MDGTGMSGIQLYAEKDTSSVAPGSKAEIALTLSNPTAAHEQIRLTVDGIPLVWVSMEQSTIFLAPGEERKLSMIIQVPAASHVHAGRYRVVVRAASLLIPGPAVECEINLTVAAYEASGRITVLMDATSFAVQPGTTLQIPLVLINQGLTTDVVQAEAINLPEGWITQPSAANKLEPEQTAETHLLIEPPRSPETRAGRVPFEIQVHSQAAPEQVTVIRCTLTVAVFTQFSAQVEPIEGEAGNPTNLLVTNQGNAQEGYSLELSSADDALIFEDMEESIPVQETPQTEMEKAKIGQPIRLAPGKSGSWGFIARQAKRPLFGSTSTHPYTATVTSTNQESQEVEGKVTGKALLPMWVLVVAAAALVVLLLVVLFSFLNERLAPIAPPTLIATSTRSSVDQRAFLVDRNWYLVSFNNSQSVPGSQEPSTRFNQDGTILGNTGCKAFTGTFTTDLNTLTITTLTAAPDDCGDPALVAQEQAMLDILRSAQSYFVADTAMQIVSEKGFLNYSLTPANRPEEMIPPEAAIRGPIQAMVNEIITMDGRSSTGQSPIILWEWDFGDGGRGNGSIAQHVYAQPGRYRIQMTVTDQGGLQDSAMHEIDILAQPTATAMPTNTPVPTFTPAPTSTPLPTDQPTPTPEPTATPPPPPTEIPVVEPPRANISAPQAGFIGEPVLFDASQSIPGSSAITSYQWIFGNGSQSGPSPEAQVSFIYEQSGNFQVKVLVTDENGLSSSAATSIRIDARLDTVVWTLDTINNQPLQPGTAITLQFLAGRFEGFSGCNTYSGEYVAVDNGDGTYSVTGIRLQSGRISCPQAIMDQETRYLQVFEQVNQASVQGNVLTLVSPQGTLVFHEVGTPRPQPR